MSVGPAASVQGGVWVGVGVGTEQSLLSSCAHSTFKLSEGLALSSLTDGPVLVYLCIPNGWQSIWYVYLFLRR